MEDIDKGGGIWDISVSSPQSRCESKSDSKTTLEIDSQSQNRYPGPIYEL